MIKSLQFRSIKIGLTFWFVIIATLPLLVAVSLIYNQMANSRKESIYNKLEAVRNLKTVEINNWIDQRNGDINIIASDPHIRSLQNIYAGKEEHTQQDIKDFDEARSLFKRYLQNYDSFHEIFIISPENKQIIISSNERNEGKNRSEDSYFTGALRNQGIFIKDIYYSKTEKKPSMAFSIPVYGLLDSTNIIGILVARINLDESLYMALLNRTGMGTTGETLIVNKDVVALNQLRWHKNAPLNLKITAKTALEASQGNTGVVETTDYRGEMVLAAYTHIPSTGWGFVAKQDLKKYMLRLIN